MKLKVELTDDLYARIMRNSREPYYDVAMVIKNGVPLELEPKTMTNQEAIKELEYLEEESWFDEEAEALRMAIEALKNQKTGHWIDDNDGYGTSCSECGKWYTHPYLTKEEVIYCCKCGAKMVEPQESDELKGE